MIKLIRRTYDYIEQVYIDYSHDIFLKKCRKIEMTAKEKLITSLFDLLTIKNFLDINVSEVCQIAKVHRTTFYAYYDNLVELLVDSKDYAL